METAREADSCKNYFLIDGFPRNKDNLDGWNKQMGDKVNLQFVLFFECNDEVGGVELSSYLMPLCTRPSAGSVVSK